jgi:Uma2 family endonuclease
MMGLHDPGDPRGGAPMATVTETRKITADEFLEMDLGDGLHELVKGEIVEMPPAEYEHGYICGNSYSVLREYGRRTGHGHAATNDSSVRVDEFNVRGADVAYYSEARWPRSRIGKERPPVPPDLVIEVRSPSDRWSDVVAKVIDYLRAGVAIVLVLQPSPQTVTIYRNDADPVTLNASDTLENLPELPDFRCQVSEFFA